MLYLLMLQDSAERTMNLHYQITVKEYLEDSWSTWFDGLAITHAADGTTTLSGAVRDQSALYGLIDKARDLGLTLVAVGRSARSRGRAPCLIVCLAGIHSVLT
jgi:hypothetical protein